jgi:hypothetical protein
MAPPGIGQSAIRDVADRNAYEAATAHLPPRSDFH